MTSQEGGGREVPVLVINGPVGIGKSSVAEAISRLLKQESVAHAVVDLDYIRACYPAPGDDYFNMELGFRNLAAIWRNYHLAGAKCLIIPSVIETPKEMGKIKRAVPGAKIFMVRLTSSQSINNFRIKNRETNKDALEWHLARSAQLAKQLGISKLEDEVIYTEDKLPEDLASEILSLWQMTGMSWHSGLTSAN